MKIFCLAHAHSINPNNEACLVTCAVSLTCATWLMYAQFSFDPPLNQDTSTFVLVTPFIQMLLIQGCIVILTRIACEVEEFASK